MRETPSRTSGGSTSQGSGHGGHAELAPPAGPQAGHDAAHREHGHQRDQLPGARGMLEQAAQGAQAGPGYPAQGPVLPVAEDDQRGQHHDGGGRGGQARQQAGPVAGHQQRDGVRRHQQQREQAGHPGQRDGHAVPRPTSACGRRPGPRAEDRWRRPRTR